MTQTQKYLIAGGILLIIVIILIAYYNKQKADEKKLEELQKSSANPDIEKLCFDLSTSPDPNIFGASYWRAFQTLAAKVPCAGCRGFAEKFMTYFRDLVNAKIGKPIFDLGNYTYFNNAISKLNVGVKFEDAFQINAAH